MNHDRIILLLNHNFFLYHERDNAAPGLYLKLFIKLFVNLKWRNFL